MSVNEREEREEDEGLAHAHEGQNAPCHAHDHRGGEEGGREGGTEGGKRAQGKHGQGPHPCPCDDRLPFPEAEGEVGGAEGEDHVQDDLQGEEEAGLEGRNAQGDDWGDAGREGGREGGNASVRRGYEGL